MPGTLTAVIHLRVAAPADLTPRILDVLDDDAVSALSMCSGASLDPAGDVVEADIAREGAGAIIERLRELGVPDVGTVQIVPVATWLSRRHLETVRRTPGASADAVIWPEVTQQAYEESELNWVYASFMVLAMLIAGVAIVLDSPILVVGAMILGPEFGAVAGIALALVLRRWSLLRHAVRTLVGGFAIGIAAVTLAGLVARWAGWVSVHDLVADRPNTAFVYTPDMWSFIVALIAGAAGVLSLTSARTGGLAGVFVSVTTIPAASNLGLALAFGLWSEALGSAEQLGVNLLGMAVAGLATLGVRNTVWPWVDARRPARRRVRTPYV